MISFSDFVVLFPIYLLLVFNFLFFINAMILSLKIFYYFSLSIDLTHIPNFIKNRLLVLSNGLNEIL